MIDKHKVFKVIRQAGQIIKDNFGSKRGLKQKTTVYDLVTATDKMVEEFLKDELNALMPGSSFLAEETDPGLKQAEILWIIDPIDGTTNFVHQHPFVCTSVALALNGTIVQGFVYAPILDEFFYAERGKGAYLNDEKISVSDIANLQQGLFATGFPYDFATCSQNNIRILAQVRANAQGVRRCGSAALDLCYTACGRLDGYWEFGLNPWDVAAGWLLVEEAGGKLTTITGEPYQLGKNNLLAANPILHQNLKQLISVVLES